MVQNKTENLPIFDFSLANLKGEIWRGFPHLEEYIQVSQFGRVKRLPRTVKTTRGDIRIYGEKIIKSVVVPKTSFANPVYHYDLVATFQIKRRLYSFSPARMVFYLFVKKFPLNNSHYGIIFKNGDDLDIRPDNMELLKNPQFKRDYQKYRVSLNEGRRIEFYKKLTFSKAVINRRKNISCYSSEGEKMNTFSGLQEANHFTGLAVKDIEKALAEPFTTLSNFYWRSGKKEKIDLSLIKREEERLLKEKTGMKITQFDLNGNPINFYLTLEDAAMDNKIPESSILMALNRKTKVAGYYLWRAGKWDSKIPGI